MQKIVLSVGVVILLAAGVYVAVGYSNDTSKTATSEQEMNRSTEAREVSVEAGDAYFATTRIKADVGETLRIKLTNSGKWRHDFVIDELNVHSADLKGGESAEVEFKVTKKGIYTYYCSIPGHRGMGQIGHLVVGNYDEAELEQLISQKMQAEGDQKIAVPGEK